MTTFFITLFISLLAGLPPNTFQVTPENQPSFIDSLVNSPTGELVNNGSSDVEREDDENLSTRKTMFFAKVQPGADEIEAGTFGVFSAKNLSAPVTLTNISEDESPQITADDETDAEVEIIVQETTVKTCPEGKFLNPKTNRCKNIQTIEETSTGKTITTYDPETGEATVVKICNEGYHLNSDTNRCNKNKDDSSGNSTSSTSNTLDKTCPEGKYLNPETNRCKKIDSNNGADYALDVPKLGDKAENSFVAVGVIIIIAISGVAIIIYQFRKEILKGLKGIKTRLHR